MHRGVGDVLPHREVAALAVQPPAQHVGVVGPQHPQSLRPSGGVAEQPGAVPAWQQPVAQRGAGEDQMVHPVVDQRGQHRGGIQVDVRPGPRAVPAQHRHEVGAHQLDRGPVAPPVGPDHGAQAADGGPTTPARPGGEELDDVQQQHLAGRAGLQQCLLGQGAVLAAAEGDRQGPPRRAPAHPVVCRGAAGGVVPGVVDPALELHVVGRVVGAPEVQAHPADGLGEDDAHRVGLGRPERQLQAEQDVVGQAPVHPGDRHAVVVDEPPVAQLQGLVAVLLPAEPDPAAAHLRWVHPHGHRLGRHLLSRHRAAPAPTGWPARPGRLPRPTPPG